MASHLLVLIVFSTLVSVVFAMLLREDRKARIVNKNHFEEALRSVRSSVTEEVIKYYDRLAEQLGQTAVRKVATGNAQGGMEFL